MDLEISTDDVPATRQRPDICRCGAVMEFQIADDACAADRIRTGAGGQIVNLQITLDDGSRLDRKSPASVELNVPANPAIGSDNRAIRYLEVSTDL